MSVIYRTWFLFCVMFLFVTVPALASGKKQTQNQARIRICQSKEAGIRNRTANMIRMGERMVENFDVKQQKVVDYYTQKMVPVGKIVPNFGNLVTEVSNKKAEVLTNLAKARAEGESFGCNRDNPLEYVSDFNKHMRSTSLSLNNYRDSIKNLIVAVRSSAGEKTMP